MNKNNDLKNKLLEKINSKEIKLKLKVFLLFSGTIKLNIM